MNQSTQHQTSVRATSNGWIVKCSCGFESKRQSSYANAQYEENEHLIAATRGGE